MLHIGPYKSWNFYYQFPVITQILCTAIFYIDLGEYPSGVELLKMFEKWKVEALKKKSDWKNLSI